MFTKRSTTLIKRVDVFSGGASKTDSTKQWGPDQSESELLGEDADPLVFSWRDEHPDGSASYLAAFAIHGDGMPEVFQKRLECLSIVHKLPASALTEAQESLTEILSFHKFETTDSVEDPVESKSAVVTSRESGEEFCITEE